MPCLSRRLPIGVAGIVAGCFGVAGAIVGMSEVWYTGPIAKMAGAEFGADLGFEVSVNVCKPSDVCTAYNMRVGRSVLIAICSDP